MGFPKELLDEIEEAFDRRGHVTLRLRSGESLEGFVFNRELDNPRLPEDNFVEILLKDADERRRVPIAEIAGIEMTGRDHAESYEEGLKRTRPGGGPG